MLRPARGFTLTELITVMAIVVILAVVAMPNLTGMNVVKQRVEYDKVVSVLTYARKSAISRRRYACVAVSSTAVTLTIDGNPPESTTTPFGGSCPFVTALALPSPDAACAATNQTCVKATTITSSASAFQFDPLGRASTVVTVTVAGFPAIKVEGETGYIH